MYQIEWNKIEAAIMEKLSDKIERLQYMGKINPGEPESPKGTEFKDGAFFYTYHDEDYNEGAQLRFCALVKSEEDDAKCRELIPSILEKIGYSMCAEPSPEPEPNGFITITVVMKHEKPWGIMPFDWSEEEMKS